MTSESDRDGRVTVVDRRAGTSETEDGRVLRVVRESLRQEPPVVQFAPQSKRCLGLFH